MANTAITWPGVVNVELRVVNLSYRWLSVANMAITWPGVVYMEL